MKMAVLAGFLQCFLNTKVADITRVELLHRGEVSLGCCVLHHDAWKHVADHTPQELHREVVIVTRLEILPSPLSVVFPSLWSMHQ